MRNRLSTESFVRLVVGLANIEKAVSNLATVVFVLSLEKPSKRNELGSGGTLSLPESWSQDLRFQLDSRSVERQVVTLTRRLARWPGQVCLSYRQTSRKLFQSTSSYSAGCASVVAGRHRILEGETLRTKEQLGIPPNPTSACIEWQRRTNIVCRHSRPI